MTCVTHPVKEISLKDGMPIFSKAQKSPLLSCFGFVRASMSLVTTSTDFTFIVCACNERLMAARNNVCMTLCMVSVNCTWFVGISLSHP